MKKQEDSSQKNYIVSTSPLFVYTLAFVLGTAYGNSSKTPSIVLSAVLSVTFLIALYYVFKKTLLIISFFLLGSLGITLSPYAYKNLYSSLLMEGETAEIKLTVKSAVKINRKYSTAYCFSKDYNENIVLYIYPDINESEILPGDTIVTQLRPKRIRSAGEFDYSEYMAKQRFFSCDYLYDGNYYVIKQNRETLKYFFQRKAAIVVDSFRKSIENNEWSSIYIAVVSGNKSYLSPVQREAFIASGSMHLMAVSGLHVGFIFLIFNTLFSLAGNKVRIIRTVLIIMIVWLYSIITGFSPSAIRASVMITVMLISKLMYRKFISLNSLCIAALITLSISPESLFELGFQLSYLAMLSIIFIFPSLKSSFVSGNKIISYLWSVIALSVACQIATFPVIAYNFGYITPYFLISNIMMMPLTALVLIMTVVLIPAQTLGLQTTLIIECTEYIVRVLFAIAQRIQLLPLSTIEVSPGFNLICTISLITLMTISETGSSFRVKLVTGIIILTIYLLSTM